MLYNYIMLRTLAILYIIEIMLIVIGLDGGIYNPIKTYFKRQVQLLSLHPRFKILLLLDLFNETELVMLPHFKLAVSSQYDISITPQYCAAQSHRNKKPAPNSSSLVSPEDRLKAPYFIPYSSATYGVAELINFPFTYLGKISGNVDANNLQTSGYWQLSWGGNTGCSNFPSNNYFYGILIVFNTPNAVYQMAINGDGVHSRLMFDYNWGGWRVL